MGYPPLTRKLDVRSSAAMLSLTAMASSSVEPVVQDQTSIENGFAQDHECPTVA